MASCLIVYSTIKPTHTLNAINLGTSSSDDSRWVEVAVAIIVECWYPADTDILDTIANECWIVRPSITHSLLKVYLDSIMKALEDNKAKVNSKGVDDNANEESEMANGKANEKPEGVEDKANKKIKRVDCLTLIMQTYSRDNFTDEGKLSVTRHSIRLREHTHVLIVENSPCNCTKKHHKIFRGLNFEPGRLSLPFFTLMSHLTR